MNKTDLDCPVISESATLAIPGLKYIPRYITADEQNKLLDSIDQQSWGIDSVELQRRLQQHGYKYIYKDGFLVASLYLGPLPNWANFIAQRLTQEGITTTVPDQMTVNEYDPGQGLTGHIDCPVCFGDTIITLNLGSYCVMDFIHACTQEKRQLLLSPRSLLVLQEEARYGWEHSVAACKVDWYQGQEFMRTRRVAMTFREALFPHK